MQFAAMFLPSGWRGTPDARVYAQVLEQAQAAEELGYDAVWLTEHHFTQYGRPGISPLAAAIATRTRRIRIGTAVYVLPIHHPLHIAADAAVVDLLSGGRLDFGIGRGYQPEELHAFGADFESSRARHNEALEIILQAWTRGEVEHDGEYWQIPRREFRPRPLQQPHPPIWQPIVSPTSFEEAVRLGKHAIIGSYATPLQRLETAYATWFATIDRLGQDRAAFQAMCSVLVHVADTEEAARRNCEEAFVWNARMFGSLLEPGRPEFKQYFANLSFDEIYDGCAVIGSVERVAQQVEWLASIGVEHLACVMNLGDMNHDAVLRSMDLFARQIMPRFRTQR